MNKQAIVTTLRHLTIVPRGEVRLRMIYNGLCAGNGASKTYSGIVSREFGLAGDPDEVIRQYKAVLDMFGVLD